jgi:hypothetical protein
MIKLQRISTHNAAAELGGYTTMEQSIYGALLVLNKLYFKLPKEQFQFVLNEANGMEFNRYGWFVVESSEVVFLKDEHKKYNLFELLHNGHG